MGYTHYIKWEKLSEPRRQENFQAALNEMGKYVKRVLSVNDNTKKLIGSVLRNDRHFKKTYELEFLKAGKPIIWYDNEAVNVRAISFNGIQGDDDFADFMLFREEFDTEGVNYCKTGQNNYDHVVVGCLTILNHQLSGIVESDGTSEDWEPGVQVLNKIMGSRYQNPLGTPAMSYLDKLHLAANSVESEKKINTKRSERQLFLKMMEN